MIGRLVVWFLAGWSIGCWVVWSLGLAGLVELVGLVGLVGLAWLWLGRRTSNPIAN